jgi:hypothetical protein
MAQGDCSIYNHAKEIILLGDIHFDSDIFKIVLLGSGYSFNVDGNNGYANVSAEEITASGYAAGGETLTGLTVTQNDTGDYAKWDAADVTWSSLATATIAHAVIYDDTITTPVADPLVCRFEITTNSNGGNYQLSFNSGGILQLS